jgi:hypothetical protein
LTSRVCKNDVKIGFLGLNCIYRIQ